MPKSQSFHHFFNLQTSLNTYKMQGMVSCQVELIQLEEHPMVTPTRVVETKKTENACVGEDLRQQELFHTVGRCVCFHKHH